MYKTHDDREIAQSRHLILVHPLSILWVASVVIIELLNPLYSSGSAGIRVTEAEDVVELWISDRAVFWSTLHEASTSSLHSIID